MALIAINVISQRKNAPDCDQCHFLDVKILLTAINAVFTMGKYS